MTMTWRTRDGREIPISDMDDEHLLRTIFMLRANARRYVLALCMQELGALSRARAMLTGDAALDAIDSEVNEFMNTPDMELLERQPLMRALLKEAEARGFEVPPALPLPVEEQIAGVVRAAPPPALDKDPAEMSNQEIVCRKSDLEEWAIKVVERRGLTPDTLLWRIASFQRLHREEQARPDCHEITFD